MRLTFTGEDSCSGVYFIVEWRIQYLSQPLFSLDCKEYAKDKNEEI